MLFTVTGVSMANSRNKNTQGHEPLTFTSPLCGRHTRLHCGFCRRRLGRRAAGGVVLCDGCHRPFHGACCAYRGIGLGARPARADSGQGPYVAGRAEDGSWHHSGVGGPEWYRFELRGQITLLCAAMLLAPPECTLFPRGYTAACNCHGFLLVIGLAGVVAVWLVSRAAHGSGSSCLWLSCQVYICHVVCLPCCVVQGCAESRAVWWRRAAAGPVPAGNGCTLLLLPTQLGPEQGGRQQGQGAGGEGGDEQGAAGRELVLRGARRRDAAEGLQQVGVE